MTFPQISMTSSYSRQQLGAATGVPGDLLAYWIKLGLLRSNSGGVGKGRHRLFGFEALHIAALLAELARYGMNSTTLGRAAEVLWKVADIATCHPDISETDALDCADLKNARSRKDFDAWLAARQQGSVAIGPRAFEMEPWFDRGAEFAFSLHFDLFSERSFTDLDTRWIVALDSKTMMMLPADVFADIPALKGLSSYIALHVSNIIQRAWARLEPLSPDRPASSDRSSRQQTDEANHD